MKTKYALKIFMCVVIVSNMLLYLDNTTNPNRAQAIGESQLIYEYTGTGGGWSGPKVEVSGFFDGKLVVSNSKGIAVVPKDKYTTGAVGFQTGYGGGIHSSRYKYRYNVSYGYFPYTSLINTYYSNTGVWSMSTQASYLDTFASDTGSHFMNEFGDLIYMSDSTGDVSRAYTRPIDSKSWTSNRQYLPDGSYAQMMNGNSKRVFYSRYTAEWGGFNTLYSVNLDGSGHQYYYKRNMIAEGEFPKHGYFLYSVNGTGTIYKQGTFTATESALVFLESDSANIYDITDNYAYFVKRVYNPTGQDFYYPWRKHISGLLPEEKLLDFPITSLLAERNDRGFYYAPLSEPTKIYRWDLNKKPSITLTSPLTQSVAAVTGLNTFKIEGFVQDVDNDTLTVSADIKGVTRTTTLINTSVDKSFSFNFDAIADSLPIGTHVVTVTAKDDFGGTSTKTLSITVKARAQNNLVITLADTVYYDTLFSDPEADLRKSERWKYVHNQSYYENPIGVIPDNTLWRNTPYTIFPKTGHYLITLQGMDTTLMAEYQRWSQDSLDQLNIYVHRKPVPQFTITVYTNGAGGFPTVINDTSFDLDKQSLDNGIAVSEWSWKDSTASVWTSGTPPINLTINHTYELKLRVKDHQGAWSDPLIKTFSTTGTLPILTNNAPVATMTIPSGTQANPTVFTTQKPTFSWNQTDSDAGTVFKSFEIQVTNDANTATVFSSGTVSQNTAATTKSWTTTSDLPAGQKLRTRVRVNDGLVWSSWSAQTWMIINCPPIVNFDWSPKPVWEGDTVTLTNQSSDPDNDALTYIWSITGPGGYQQTTTTIHATRKLSQPGDYSVTLTASDGKVQTNVTRTLRVESLLLEANVSYTDLWLEHHLMMGHETVQNPKSFYTGEIFVVSAVGSLAATNSVTASLDALGRDGNPIAISVQLTSTHPANHFQAELYDPILSSLTGGLPEGQHQIKFKIEYANGVMKEISIPIQIIGHVQGAVNVHRRQ